MQPPLVFHRSRDNPYWELTTVKLLHEGVTYHVVRATEVSTISLSISFEPGEVVIYPAKEPGGVYGRLDPVMAAYILLVAERIPLTPRSKS